ncbi:hypothetical protein GUJ93_ZPchr0012g19204 [Zizania palustris]|uniref:Uncharacterized protein n=1 Tax=Zizania palustris TaxID=103762 RepID=A0A8J6BSK5_ZIZPA|nr:hypothetical protein GUJ93_ZPchr0012g19204 [Zizania palustris]
MAACAALVALVACAALPATTTANKISVNWAPNTNYTDLKPKLKKITFPFFATLDLTPARRPAVRRPAVIARLPSRASATGWSLDAEQCPPPSHPAVVPARARVAGSPPARARVAGSPPAQARVAGSPPARARAVGSPPAQAPHV